MLKIPSCSLPREWSTRVVIVIFQIQLNNGWIVYESKKAKRLTSYRRECATSILLAENPLNFYVHDTSTTLYTSQEIDDNSEESD